MNLPKELKACFCKSGKSYEDCCRPVHLDSYQALTAEQLMRSRFSAFAIASKFSEYQSYCENFLLQTWHPTTKPGSLELDTTLNWVDLKIQGRKDGKKRHHTGKVHFIALYEEKLNFKTTGCLEEISQFEKDSKGGWLYVDGEIING